MTESALLFINEGSVTKEMSNEDETPQQEAQMQQEKASNDEKENQNPQNDADELELSVIQQLKNEEDINASVKSLDGSIFDNDMPDEVDDGPDQPIGDSLQTIEPTDADDEDEHIPGRKQAEEKPNNDVLSTSDIHVDEPESDDHHMEDYEHADEQRVLQTQANYNLSSLNYNKNKPTTQPSQDSDSEAELFEASKCKCEEVSRDPKAKTKVCTML